MSTRGYTSPVSTQKQDEPSSSGVLNYRNASPDLKSKIDEKRLTEWKKYQHFTASIPIAGKELEALLAEGHVVIPSKWVDTIKNWYECHKPGFEPRYESRLVGCGKIQQDDGVRTDAPMSDLETHCVVAGFAACNRTTISCSDITNASFQAQLLDRLILMRQPQSGLPGLDPEAALLVRVPLYGLRDSGRGQGCEGSRPEDKQDVSGRLLSLHW